MKCEFNFFVLPKNKTLKIVLKDIPTNISKEELRTELINDNPYVILVKRYGPVNNTHTNIYMVILNHVRNSKNIFELINLF